MIFESNKQENKAKTNSFIQEIADELNSYHLDVFYHKDSKLVTIEEILLKELNNKINVK